MKNLHTSEVPFLADGVGGYLLAIRAGVPRDVALSLAADFLDTALGLMLGAEEIDSTAAATAALWLIETARAALAAAGVQGAGGEAHG